MASRIIRDERDRDAWFRFLSNQPLPMTVSHAKGARRSNPQNATLHMWFSQIAAETYETPSAVKGACKRRHGLPIMEAENQAWVAKWEPLYGPLEYEMQVQLFEIIPMTSLFTVKQMSAFMDAVQLEYRAQGIALIDPEARRYEEEFGSVQSYG
jgi:hypothetical protein